MQIPKAILRHTRLLYCVPAVEGATGCELWALSECPYQLVRFSIHLLGGRRSATPGVVATSNASSPPIEIKCLPPVYAFALPDEDARMQTHARATMPPRLHNRPNGLAVCPTHSLAFCTWKDHLLRAYRLPTHAP